jgi:cell division protein FtsB
MDSGWLGGVATIIAGVLLWWGTRYSVKRTLKSTEGKDRYDQLQEDLAAERKTRQEQVAALMTEISSLRTELRGLQGEKRVALDYVEKLRKHITEEKPPPPPPYPEGMG